MREFMQYKLKDMIVFNILTYIETRGSVEKRIAKEKLEELAKVYKIPLRNKVVNCNLKNALMQFIDNKRGFVETIPQLYNLLK